MAVIHRAKSKPVEELQALTKKAKKDRWSDSGLLINTICFVALSIITYFSQDEIFYPLAEKMPGGIKIILVYIHVFTLILPIIYKYLLIAFIFGMVFAIIKTAYSSTRYDKDIEILSAGIEGEERALSAVSSLLPDTYDIYTNCIVSYEGEQSETDMVIIGPMGVCIVEIKNHKGLISGDWSGQRLYQTKEGHDDDEKDFYNPVKQVGTHVWRLSKVLKDLGINTWVDGCVLFTNNDVKLDVANKNGINANVYTISDISKLVSFIRRKETDELSNKQILMIKQYFEATNHC